MKKFTALILALDQTTKTNHKIEALEDYFRQATDEDKVWALALLSGRRPKRIINMSRLWEWAVEAVRIPPWLFEESYHVVGDFAEAIALLLPPNVSGSDHTLSYWMQLIRSLGTLDDEEKKQLIKAAWDKLNEYERFVFNKLITGGFRIGVSEKLVVKALSRFTNTDPSVMAHRLMGNWMPGETSFTQLITAGNDPDISRPYPFFLAYALEQEVETLGDPLQWQAEWKWDGIRGQLIKRKGELFIWSRGEELVTAKFPELQPLAALIPDGTVLDGEILSYKEGRALSFNVLQTRIGRKNITEKILREAPVVLLTYDLLEYNGTDFRNRPLFERRAVLENLLTSVNRPDLLPVSVLIPFTSWNELALIREQSRELYTEGIMLKKTDSPYETGRKRGNWWKWKIDPLSIDAVLIYAQRGHGRRANWYTDYTFAVWDKDVLVPFTKAYSGLTDQELKEVDTFVKKNTLDKFGPVRSVTPELVFEIAFEGIQRSSRHKSGVALRFPRILRWRRDKKKEAADTIEHLREMLARYGA